MMMMMEKTHLDVEQRRRIDIDAVLFLQVLGDFHLVLLFDSLDGALETRILSQRLQLGQLVQVDNPIFSNMLTTAKIGSNFPVF